MDEISLLEHADNNKDNDRNEVRSHLEKLLIAHAQIRNIVVDNKESAEKNRTDYAEVRSPNSEDNKRNCKPASVTEGII